MMARLSSAQMELIYLTIYFILKNIFLIGVVLHSSFILRAVVLVV